ncbi:hypothetical protein V7S43_015057 [Phytophthora oleae]|uniref:Uncharacterized protein n=1 Tax=Phytophthora oleae TaxID=2107226 RepID=A0ABD3F053_9STRA
MGLEAIQAATLDLFVALKILVGQRSQTSDPGYQTGSSHYASANKIADDNGGVAPALGKLQNFVTYFGTSGRR